MDLQHWKIQRDDQNITWAYFDKHDSGVNTISHEVLEELAQIIDATQADDSLGLIIASSKKTGFIAGADIEGFKEIENAEVGFRLISYGQEVFNALAAMTKPSVAMISGFCVGGGFELALACHYRVAQNDKSTRLGLPEVLLGIHPGWGGTVRLPRLMGGLKAMPYILSGKTLDARKAYKLGAIDMAVPERQLKNAARYFILNKPPKHKPSRLDALTNAAWIRPLLAKMMRKQVAKKVSEKHYPAPYAAIKQWSKYGVSQSAFEPEAHSIAELFMTEAAQNLIRVFFLQTQMKNLAKDIKYKAHRVHVVGAGTMGGDIAIWCALNGIDVTLQDREMKFIAPVIARAAKLYKRKLKARHLVQQALDRLMPDVKGYGIAQADIIIEAIFEDLEVKQTLFKDLEERAKPEAMLATNTSSIPLDDINQVLKQPERLVGIHFFNPVAMMQLVEVVSGKITSEAITGKAIAFVKQIKKLPLPVKSSPGFLVNRVLMPYLMESFLLMDEGVSKEAIDCAAKDFGMPMGPIELADAVGLDVGLSVANELIKHFGGVVPQCLKEKVEQGQLGKKTGEGFYAYKKGKLVRTKNKVSYSQDIQDRLIARMVDEAKAVLKEGVVSDADLLDAGMIFGTGFAPFRGGPLHYSDGVF
jgi:3-hydroxyacyl-CoA dehydrogenase / enoyl-CoA hydratase / 3-hydroxybutyryl-CoA epimerase